MPVAVIPMWSRHRPDIGSIGITLGIELPALGIELPALGIELLALGFPCADLHATQSEEWAQLTPRLLSRQAPL